MLFRSETSNEGSYTLPGNAPSGYIDIPLDKPADGVTPAGEKYSYCPNDASIGDVDGDGNYEIILKWDPSNAHDNAAKLAAALLKQYGLDINHLYTHTHWLNVRDGRNGTIDQLNTMYNRYKMCPAYILPHWAEFKKKVQSYLNAGTSTISALSTKQLYRVRKSWADAKSQLGAYSSLENAKKACKAGYSVFDNSGKVVYFVVKTYAKGTKVTLNNVTL